MSIGLIGTKIGMTREFMESGQSVPVTVIRVEKGRVLDVLLSADGKRRATLALDGGGRVDEPGYKERYLETALPKDGGPVRCVLGDRMGAHGVLVGRDRKKETATIRFDDDDAIVTVPMDFVAEWCGGDVDMM